MAGVPVIEPVGAAALAKDVAKLVEHGEGVTVLQDARARLAKSASCLDPELGFAFAGLDRRYGHDAAPVPSSLSRGPGSPGGIEFSGLGLGRRSTAAQHEATRAFAECRRPAHSSRACTGLSRSWVSKQAGQTQAPQGGSLCRDGDYEPFRRLPATPRLSSSRLTACHAFAPRIVVPEAIARR